MNQPHVGALKVKILKMYEGYKTITNPALFIRGVGKGVKVITAICSTKGKKVNKHSWIRLAEIFVNREYKTVVCFDLYLGAAVTDNSP